MAACFGNEEDYEREKEYSQIYEKTLGIFEQIKNLIGDEEISLEEYYRILDSGFSELEVGIIPKAVDRVIVGETGEDGTKYPYTLTFIYKTGMEKKVALKQPLSFNNVCSHASDEGSLKCLHASSDTCGDGCSLVPTESG